MLTEKSGRLVWCTLVALALARQNGDILPAARENLFPIRWLTTVLKQRHFLRDVAPDIEWLLKQGRQLGASMKLVSKLNYLWRSCTGELIGQSGPFQLTYTLEIAKDMYWNYRLLSDREWSGWNAVTPSTDVNAIYLPRVNLDVALDDSSRQMNPLAAHLTGNVAETMKLFNRCDWQAEPESGASLPHQYSLMAGQGVPGKGN